jgi:Asp-tRNA(Asn)/Glu-tRNA(Gln) amidotransferase A subunit family amidase
MLRSAFLTGEIDPIANLENSLARANGNAGRNTYIAFDPEWSVAEGERQRSRFTVHARETPLFGLPVSIKDCFDLQGFKTSSGSRFYAGRNPAATQDSAVAARLRSAGAFLTGKTHLHQLAYGITGQNRDYGDCLQPRDAARLTGGSSSGAAASLQEGSAIAAIGTDTGGSIRVPAALCGLSGYRSSLGIADWQGGAHLAPSFDTVGWLFQDLRDAPLLAAAIFELPPTPEGSMPFAVGGEPAKLTSPPKIGVLVGPLLECCDATVLGSFKEWQERLRSIGSQLEPFQPDFWSESWDIFSPIQGFEAARLHAGFFDEFEPTIRDRLRWGASLAESEVLECRRRQAVFQDHMDRLFRQFDLLLAPATPVSKLGVSEDQSAIRANILRFTTPASVAGLPAIVLPSPQCGLQLLARHGDDRRLLDFAARLGEEF